MIPYKFPEEKEILLHYARFLGNVEAEEIIVKDRVDNSAEATHLAKFFWAMVDQSVKDIESGKDVLGQKDLEAWNDYIFQSVRSYLRNNGYDREWEAVADAQPL
jgi:hypothetical protein